MANYEDVETLLNEFEIPFEVVSHEPALTTEMADQFIEGIEGVRTKTMFLTNRKKTAFYLLIMDDHKSLNMDKFKEIVEANKIRMASNDSLYEKMSLSPGVVSPFGLIYNAEKDIPVYFDQEIMNEERMSFHPNTNEKTIFLKTQDLLKFLDGIQVLYTIIDL